MRGLKSKFFEDLKEGKLKKYLEYVISDDTLDLEIREDYINIYYRGGSLYCIKPNGERSYRFKFDPKYSKHKGSIYAEQIEKLINEDRYIEAIPFIKTEMDQYFGSKKRSEEKEFQQLIVRDNNTSSIANSTDYYIVDVEYAITANKSRFDMLAVKLPSDQSSKKKGIGSLVIIEVKYGNKSIKSDEGSAGLKKHLDDGIRIFSNKDILNNLQEEAKILFNQKLDLGLITSIGAKNNNNQLKKVEGKPEFIFTLINHDYESDILYEELQKCKGINNDIFDVKFSFSSFMGYGLYTDKMKTLKEIIEITSNKKI